MNRRARTMNRQLDAGQPTTGRLYPCLTVLFVMALAVGVALAALAVIARIIL